MDNSKEIKIIRELKEQVLETLTYYEEYKKHAEESMALNTVQECNVEIKKLKEQAEALNTALESLQTPNYKIILCTNGKLYNFEYINATGEDIPKDMCCENCTFNNKNKKEV